MTPIKIGPHQLDMLVFRGLVFRKIDTITVFDHQFLRHLSCVLVNYTNDNPIEIMQSITGGIIESTCDMIYDMNDDIPTIHKNIPMWISDIPLRTTVILNVDSRMRINVRSAALQLKVNNTDTLVDYIVKDNPSVEIGVIINTINSLSQSIARLIDDGILDGRTMLWAGHMMADKYIHASRSLHPSDHPASRLVFDRLNVGIACQTIYDYYKGGRIDTLSFYEGYATCGHGLWRFPTAPMTLTPHCKLLQGGNANPDLHLKMRRLVMMNHNNLTPNDIMVLEALYQEMIWIMNVKIT